ncbi:hypothetical protein POM88_039915 [Heracleum sosnowskyi]|uniref:Leucine-rich repeat-containing N-terminal plant-type domain-containing protein n=1 Tax=Heracleum sosnowskyi TaxID=360622 RepID=A0AAD8M9A4_9APIA|nr:hypothetical protein POM88_039915 [Heracleum sosnowskyi]
METSSFSSESTTNMTRCTEEERNALLEFKQGLGVADTRDILFSWKKEEEDCCNWEGVGCDNRTGHVTHLLLSSLLTSYSPYIANLAWYLDLSYNFFDFPIPKFFGSLNRLRYLDLSHSGFTGVIPQELGNLSKLQHLDLSSYSYYTTGYNFILKGGENFNWLSNLSSLTDLHLSGVKIDPPSIWASFIQKIPSLSVMRLSRCNLSAPSSTLSNFSSSISTLHLRGNHINSSIFKWLSHLSGSLVDLDLGMNGLEGRIPESFGHMTALTHLYLDENHLTGVLSILSTLQVADFSYNNFTGNLDDLLSGPLPLLQKLLISRNKLTGSLPDITQHPSLRELALNSNHLNGYLPTVFKHHSALQVLDLSNNHLRGSLPDFTGFAYLELLYLHNNEFSGSLPEFTGCSSLQELRLGENRLTEWKTQSTGLLPRLKDLDLSRNSIHSTISELHLSNLSSLKLLRTSFNSLTFEFSSGWLPPFQLQEISLASCNLGPNFPIWIRNQRNIDHLDLSNNQISDTIPLWFWNVSSSMMLLNLSSNKIRDTIASSDFANVPAAVAPSPISTLPPASGPTITPASAPATTSYIYVDNVLARWKGQEFEYGRNFAYLKMIDLSTNELTGEIPTGITRLLELKGLNLSGNKFIGRVPLEIGQLKGLECLDLSKNRFSGEIPPSMSGLYFLAYLDVSDNNFSGGIPSGTQLQGFNISTYEGNTGLCGKPLKNSCPGDEPPDHIRPSSGEVEVDGEDSEYKRWLYISAALGFSTTFWGFIGSLVINRRWRHAYFLFLYKLKERIYVATAVHIARLQRKA